MMCKMYLVQYLLMCFVFITLNHLTVNAIIPKGVSLPIIPCRRSDPELNTCLLENVSPVLKKLRNGIPEWNLQSLEPLHIDFMNVEGDLEVGKVKVNIKNITVFGATGTIVQKLKFDPESLTGEMTYRIPVIRVFCDYSATGRMFFLPLDSTAHFEGNFTDIVITMNLRLGNVQRRNKTYATIEKMTKKMRIDKAHVYITSIDPAQQPQVNLLQDFCNRNDRLILDAITPLTDKYAADLDKHVAEIYVRRIPVNKWFILD